MAADPNESATPSIGTEQPGASGVGPWNTAERAGAGNRPGTGANTGAADNPAGNHPGTGAGDFATEQARALWEGAKDSARSGLGQYKETTAKGIGDLATALRTSAGELESREQPTVARFARSAADGLQQLSGALERRDLDGLVREVETFARRQPLAFFGAAMAVGFLAVRFIKSTSQPER